MSLEVISLNSDNIVRLDVLQNASSGAFIAGATVSFVLKDAAGNVLQNTTTMVYVPGYPGRYEGTIPASVTSTLTLNNLYALEITAVYAGTTLFRKLSCIAKYRSSQ
jgi:hypothetical protein